MCTRQVYIELKPTAQVALERKRKIVKPFKVVVALTLLVGFQAALPSAAEETRGEARRVDRRQGAATSPNAQVRHAGRVNNRQTTTYHDSLRIL